MENASKALLMAAGMLMAMMVISLGVYLFATFGSFARDVYKENEQNILSQFNSQFTQYESKEISIYDVVTIANLAKENNEQYSLTSVDASENSYYIVVSFKKGYTTINNLQDKSQTDFIELIKKDLDEYGNSPNALQKQLYDCKVKISSITGRVYKVEIKEK